MAHRTPAPRARQVAALQRQFAQAPGLPFAGVLDPATLEQALDREGVSFRERLFAPLATLWVLLAQVLDPDHSGR
jgi:hypothetical protein